MFSFLVKKILAAFKCIPNLYFLYYCLYNQLYNQRLYQQHTGDQILQFSFKVIRNMNFHQYCKAKKKLNCKDIWHTFSKYLFPNLHIAFFSKRNFLFTTIISIHYLHESPKPSHMFSINTPYLWHLFLIIFYDTWK